MTTAGLSGLDLMTLGRDLDWRALGTIAAGEEAWRRVADDGEAARSALPYATAASCATRAAIGRYCAWDDAGRPELTGDLVVRMRFVGSLRTQTILRNALFEERLIPPPAVWFLANYVTVLAIGADARGLATLVPPARYERLILLNDRDLDDVSLLSVFKHELAHTWLMPPKPPMSDLEDLVFSGPAAWQFAATTGSTDEYVASGVTAEQQACELAREWGATGVSADGEHCAEGPRLLAREAARATQEIER